MLVPCKAEVDPALCTQPGLLTASPVVKRAQRHVYYLHSWYYLYHIAVVCMPAAVSSRSRDKSKMLAVYKVCMHHMRR